MNDAEAKVLVNKWVKDLQRAVSPGYKEMIASYGGVEEYIRWVRGRDEPPSPIEIWQRTGKLPRYD